MLLSPLSRNCINESNLSTSVACVFSTCGSSAAAESCICACVCVSCPGLSASPCPRDAHVCAACRVLAPRGKEEAARRRCERHSCLPSNIPLVVSCCGHWLFGVCTGGGPPSGRLPPSPTHPSRSPFLALGSCEEKRKRIVTYISLTVCLRWDA